MKPRWWSRWVARRRLERDPTWYRTAYTIAAQQLQSATADGKPKPLPAEVPALLREYLEISRPTDGARLAETSAMQLLALTRSNLRRAGWKYPRRPPRTLFRWRRRITLSAGPLGAAPELAAFLDSTLEPATVVLIWSARVDKGEEIQPVKVTRPDPTGFLNRRTWSEETWLEAYLADLVAARRPRARLFRLIAWLGVRRWRAPDEPSYRVRYNLACLFCRVAERRGKGERNAEMVELAIEQLRLAFATPGAERRTHLARWAWKDPALAPLRRRSRREFMEIVGPEPAAQKPVPRARR